jgi:hypothetical protein
MHYRLVESKNHIVRAVLGNPFAKVVDDVTVAVSVFVKLSTAVGLYALHCRDQWLQCQQIRSISTMTRTLRWCQTVRYKGRCVDIHPSIAEITYAYMIIRKNRLLTSSLTCKLPKVSSGVAETGPHMHRSKVRPGRFLYRPSIDIMALSVTVGPL